VYQSTAQARPARSELGNQETRKLCARSSQVIHTFARYKFAVREGVNTLERPHEMQVSID